MSNLFIIEIYKLFKNKIFGVIFLMSLFLGIILPPDSHASITQYENIGISFYYTCFLMIFPILFGALSFGNDFLERTINNEVSSGHSRFKIFIFKVIVYFIGINLIILIIPSVNLTINYASHRYDSYNLINQGNILIKTFLTTSLLGMAVSSVNIFMAFVFRDVGKTVGISLGLFLMNIILLNSSNDIRATCFRFLPLAQMRLILYRPLITNQFKEASLIGIGTILFFLTISYLYFKNTELH